MKTLIYITGIAGGLLLLMRLLGIFMEFPYNRTFLLAGTILLSLVFLPLSIADKYRHEKKINSIINSYKGKKQNEKYTKKGESKTKLWDMNNSPFRERKSGITWHGGNIHARNASRNTRRTFLK